MTAAAPDESPPSMAARFVRRSHGRVPLSAGEEEFLRRKDEAAWRQQRLLEVRRQEKRAAQLVTQRYRDNLRRLQAQRLRGVQHTHQQQQEAQVSDLQRKYALSLQHAGTAQRQAREMLAQLVEQAHAEQDKWAFNEARVASARSGEAARAGDAEKAAALARRQEVEQNLQRLKEESAKQRAHASIRARREQEKQLEAARRQQEAAQFRRRTAKEEVFTMPRPHGKDVDAYQFTRLHCVPAPRVPPTAAKPRAEVKVVRHNRAHPSGGSSIDDAGRFRDEMDRKWEQARVVREENAEAAGQRGEQALEYVKATKDGEKAIEWLRQLDKAQCSERRVQFGHEALYAPLMAPDEDDPAHAGDKAAEEAFVRMFPFHGDELELSGLSVRTEEEQPPVDRVAVSPVSEKLAPRDSIDPADSELEDGDDDSDSGRSGRSFHGDFSKDSVASSSSSKRSSSKVRERLQPFGGRSSASSSIAQFSLPLSDSMSSVNDSFVDQHPVDQGDDSFVHKLVPMFPELGTQLVVRQTSDDNQQQMQQHADYDVQLAEPALSRMQSLLSGSESGMSSIGFSALDIARDARAVRTRSRVESGEEESEYHEHARRRLSSESGASVDAHFKYLVSVTSAVGKALPLPLHFPAMPYGNVDMRTPPPPLQWGRSSSSSSSSSPSAPTSRSGVVQGSDEVAIKNAALTPSPPQLPATKSEAKGPPSRHAGVAATVEATTSGVSDLSRSHGSEQSDDDVLLYETFRRGLLEGRMASLPPPPFGDLDMSRPPAPLVSNARSSRSSSSGSHASSRRDSRRQSVASCPVDVAALEHDEEQKQEESVDNSSCFSEEDEEDATVRIGGDSRDDSRDDSGGDSRNDSRDDNSDEGRAQGAAVSLADAFRQRHPRFQQRVAENRAEQRRKREALDHLQQRHEQAARPQRSAPSGSQRQDPDDDADDAAALPAAQQRLLGRLAVGARAQVSPQEMKERTRRLYQKLPEVVERQRQEEVLRRRQQRLAELREQEKARRTEQKQRREQQRRRDAAVAAKQ
ncbi:hypothetical protein PybrP1_005592 [[Pythium] brassicae (nom. inval.)]|nr:hypothetical protein PybrP1_005592 [[Pythium] brassicae (nom. inval.)]